MRQTWAALAASKHKTRYVTPQQPENLPNGGLILTTCRLFRLARPVAATKLEDSAGPRAVSRQRSA